jgi:hypothetical protein
MKFPMREKETNEHHHHHHHRRHHQTTRTPVNRTVACQRRCVATKSKEFRQRRSAMLLFALLPRRCGECIDRTLAEQLDGFKVEQLDGFPGGRGSRSSRRAYGRRGEPMTFVDPNPNAAFRITLPVSSSPVSTTCLSAFHRVPAVPATVLADVVVQGYSCFLAPAFLPPA